MFRAINGWTKASIIAHLTQNWRGNSFTVKGGKFSCRYRGPDSKKCAVGMFIPDSLYEASFETLPVNRIIGPNCTALALAMPLETYALSILQGIHDYHASEWNSDALPFLIQWVEKNVEA